ncbi:MAG: DUF2243 domain-containing protein, partial [Gemmatimonadota bacterium]|nr:DUF2243 domain-containing protein [Gemmatimonadota bacterium]
MVPDDRQHDSISPPLEKYSNIDLGGKLVSYSFIQEVDMDSAGLVRSKRVGIPLGIGLGGFVDGIVLHQILQWHNMGSAVVPPTTMEAMRQNMIWDGLFHAAVWLCTLIGVYWLLNAARRNAALPSPKAFTGQLLLGWGLFNLIEGIIDHHLLGLHHVRD